MNVVAITIHKGSENVLEKTYHSILPALDSGFFSGYLIYDSSGSPSSFIDFSSPSIVYLPNQPANGITSALNTSQILCERLFPESTHYCFIHSGDVLHTYNESTDRSIQDGSFRSHPDFVFFESICLNRDYQDLIRPLFEGIEKGMSVSHIGTFISHRIHNLIGGYDYKFKYAMDYKFFLQAFKVKASYHYCLMPIVKIDMSGISSQHPYKAIIEVAVAKSKLSDYSINSLLLIAQETLIACIKRFLYELLEAVNPSLLQRIRLASNPRLYCSKKIQK